MGDDYPLQRRTVLKTSAVSLTGLSLVGVVTGAKNDQENINTDFQPDQKEEVIKFAKEFNDLDAEKRDEVWDELNDDQKRVYVDGMQPKAASRKKKDVPQAMSIGYDHEAVYQFDVKGSGDIRVFSLFHEIKWNTEDNEVVEAENNGWSDNHAPFWDDEGNRKSQIEDVSYDHTPDGQVNAIDSTRSRKMSFVGGLYGEYTYEPETTIFAERLGGSGVQACDSDGISGIENIDDPYVCGSSS